MWSVTGHIRLDVMVRRVAAADRKTASFMGVPKEDCWSGRKSPYARWGYKRTYEGISRIAKETVKAAMNAEKLGSLKAAKMGAVEHESKWWAEDLVAHYAAWMPWAKAKHPWLGIWLALGWRGRSYPAHQRVVALVTSWMAMIAGATMTGYQRGAERCEAYTAILGCATDAGSREAPFRASTCDALRTLWLLRPRVTTEDAEATGATRVMH
ncbi:hypothetical protein CYMTET_31854 [Cymbomonas tetramitiformis]|uniref:Uncharacterized protein n=1 Tax=Cymbomonas tetramitiformis TaxID=36881 RepID=A0AAE0FGS5_9CHLO|nr:hypothetical protein CYMTET_31854 [Cymbomonas tetramitiformis]